MSGDSRQPHRCRKDRNATVTKLKCWSRLSDRHLRNRVSPTPYCARRPQGFGGSVLCTAVLRAIFACLQVDAHGEDALALLIRIRDINRDIGYEYGRTCVWTPVWHVYGHVYGRVYRCVYRHLYEKVHRHGSALRAFLRACESAPIAKIHSRFARARISFHGPVFGARRRRTPKGHVPDLTGVCGPIEDPSNATPSGPNPEPRHPPSAWPETKKYPLSRRRTRRHREPHHHRVRSVPKRTCV